MTTRVALYCRVSTSTKDQTTENQLRELKSYCDRMGYEVVKIYEDEESLVQNPERTVLHTLNSARMRSSRSLMSSSDGMSVGSLVL